MTLAPASGSAPLSSPRADMLRWKRRSRLITLLRGLLPALYDDLVAQVRLSAQPLGPFVCRKASDTQHTHSHPSCQTSPASPCRKTGGGNARHASRPGSASSKSR